MDWNLGDIWEAVAGVLGDEPALLHADGAVSWSEFDRRSNALARYLLERDVEAGDKVAIYSYNRPEYLEAVFAAFKARLVPVNINYRYRAEELAYIFDNSDAVAVVFENDFAANLDSLRPGLDKVKAFVGIDDGRPRPDWADDYASVAAGPDGALGNQRSGDDLMFIYTGGTTGMPKGVMWRQEDVWVTLGGGGDLLTGEGKPAGIDEHLANVGRGQARMRLMPACPLMHGTGLLTAINALFMGGSIVTLPSRRLDAALLWSEVERHKVNAISIVGDVFARPMTKALGERSYDLTSLAMIVSSGVMWSPEVKAEMLKHHPAMVLVDSLGSSEATGFGTSVTTAEQTVALGKFQVGNKVKVFDDELREIAPGSGKRGRVARSGNIPLGYYKDPAKTAETFPVIDGVRYSMPGDYAMVQGDGTLVLLGRGSVCINTGGEKVFPEEVEEVLKRHPSVEDAAVVGLPDEKWGQAITAMVQARPGRETDEGELREHVRSLLAAYKVPKRVFAVPDIGRSPSGKMDYRAVTRMARERAGLGPEGP